MMRAESLNNSTLTVKSKRLVIDPFLTELSDSDDESIEDDYNENIFDEGFIDAESDNDNTVNSFSLN